MMKLNNGISTFKFLLIILCGAHNKRPASLSTRTVPTSLLTPTIKARPSSDPKSNVDWEMWPFDSKALTRYFEDHLENYLLFL